MSLARLSQADVGSIKLVVISYQLGFTSQTQSAQFREGLQHYPIKSLQNDFIFNATMESEEKLEQVQAFVRDANDKILNPRSGPAGAPMRFYWPEMGFDYEGFVKAFPMGARKWDYVPNVQFQMVLCKDSIYTQSLDYTQVDNWTGVYGDFLNTDQATVFTPNTDSGLVSPPNTTPPPVTPAPAPAPVTVAQGSDITNWFASLFS